MNISKGTFPNLAFPGRGACSNCFGLGGWETGIVSVLGVGETSGVGGAGVGGKFSTIPVPELEVWFPLIPDMINSNRSH